MVNETAKPDIAKAAAATPRGRRRGAKRVFAKLVLLAVVVAVSLAALELMTRAIYDRNGMHFGIEMWKYSKQLKRSLPGDAMGHEHIPNREADLMGVHVKINSTGLRDREFDLVKPPDTYRILVLGDSTTFGWGVPQDKTYAKVLEQKLNAAPPAGWPRHIEVINTGVGNYNTAQEVAYFHERGRLFQPDLVLLAFFINDAEETPRRETSWLARESYLYVFSTSAWDGLLRHVQWRQNFKDYYLGLYDDEKPGWIACQQAFRELIATCRKEHIDLRIVIIPELHKVSPEYDFQKPHDAVRALALEGDVPVVDLLPCVSDQQDVRSLWVSPGDPHPNEHACKLFAAELYAYLLKSGAQVDDGAARKVETELGQ